MGGRHYGAYGGPYGFVDMSSSSDYGMIHMPTHMTTQSPLGSDWTVSRQDLEPVINIYDDIR